LLACPAVGAANESAPDKPVAATAINKRKIKEWKFGFLILIIEVSLRRHHCPGFVPNKFVSTGKAGIHAENPHRWAQFRFA